MADTRRPTIVVSGGAGFIGCHTVELLLAEGTRVHVIDDLRHTSWRRLDPRADLISADISSAEAHEAVLRIRPHAMLHLAAQGGVNRSWADPGEDATINVVGTVRLLEAAVSAGVEHFVMASSGGALYGAAETLPTPEDAIKQPRSPYGAAKLCAETYMGTFHRIKGLPTLALRYGNVYGPGQDGTGEAGVVAITCERILRGEPPVVRGDGAQTRDFVFVTDVAEANARALRSSLTGAVNIATGIESSIRTVIEELASAASLEGSPVTAPLPDGEVARSCLDVSFAATTLGWRASVPLAHGIGQTWSAFRERNKATH